MTRSVLPSVLLADLARQTAFSGYSGAIYNDTRTPYISRRLSIGADGRMYDREESGQQEA
jgi:hypothetical protein